MLCAFDRVLHYNLIASVFQPKKSSKVKTRPSGSSLGPSSTRHHHRLLRSVPHLNHSWQSNAQLPPITDHNSMDPSLPPAAATSAHLPTPRRPPPSSSCYMLQEETYPMFAKIRPPPKVSRLDIGSTRLLRDCIYPQLPPLCIKGPPEATFDPAEPAAEAVSMGLLEEAAGLVVPTQPGARFGELSEPLSLNASTPPEGGHRSLEVGAQHQMSHSPSPLSTWTLGTSDTVTSRADKTLLGTSFHISPSSPLPATSSLSTSTRCLQPNLQAQSSTQLKPGNASPPSSTMSSVCSPHLRGVKVESPGKRPELISKREARGITKMANQACKEPLGSVKNPDLIAFLSSRAPDNRNRLRESLGLALDLPPASISGQDSFESWLPSVPNSRLLDDLTGQISPLHKAEASYMVSTDMCQCLLLRSLQ